MQRVLIITPIFPDTGGRRVEKFVRYLPQFGVEPVVLTSNWFTAISRQVQQEEFPADLLVYRTPALPDDPLKLVSRLTGKAEWRETLARWVYFPDFWAHWVPIALWKARQVIQELGIEVVLTSSPPESVHVIGALLQKWAGCQWLADFRDLWTEKKQKFHPPTGVHRRAACWLENYFLHRADRVIANTPTNALIYQRCFGVPAERMVVISNGYDPADALEPEQAIPEEHVLSIGYLGYLDKDNFPYLPVLETLDRLRAEGIPIRLEVVGYISSRATGEIQRRGYGSWIRYTPQMSNRMAMQFLQQHCDLLLVLLYDSPNSQAIVPLKLYNYLAMHRPILAVAPRGGEVERIVRETGTGSVFAVQEQEAMAHFLRACWREKSIHGRLEYRPDPGALEKYHIVRLTGALARLIQQEVAVCV